MTPAPTPENLTLIMDEYNLNAKRTAGFYMFQSGQLITGERVTGPMSQMAWDCLLLKLQKPRSLTIIGNDWHIQ
jgi:hypothetical protein